MTEAQHGVLGVLLWAQLLNSDVVERDEEMNVRADKEEVMRNTKNFEKVD